MKAALPDSTRVCIEVLSASDVAEFALPDIPGVSNATIVVQADH